MLITKNIPGGNHTYLIPRDFCESFSMDATRYLKYAMEYLSWVFFFVWFMFGWST